jgi:hypothetical protein
LPSTFERCHLQDRRRGDASVGEESQLLVKATPGMIQGVGVSVPMTSRTPPSWSRFASARSSGHERLAAAYCSAVQLAVKLPRGQPAAWIFGASRRRLAPRSALAEQSRP